jgi:glycosyltransferase involved in cell wall biosynthesis
MRVVFCWWTYETYFAACWRELARRPGVELAILALRPDPQSPAPYDSSILEGLNVRLFTREQLADGRFLLQALMDERPDVIVVPGIINRAALWAVGRRELESAAVIMAWDTPWRGTWRQQLGRHVLGARLRRDVDHVVVPGERAWQCVRRLGFAERNISRGMYGVDVATPSQETAPPPPRRGFAFVGRYVQSKGVSDLAEAYESYRRDMKADEPWPLLTCGRGALKARLGAAGARDQGFVQSSRLKEILAEVAVVVLPSLQDPWPLAIVEACAAGRAVICTEACGSSVEMVRSFYNGLVVPTASPAALARAMRWVHDHADLLPEMGRRSRSLAEAYSAPRWADRWSAVLERVGRG